MQQGVSNKPGDPHSSCRSPGEGRCGCTPPCSWAPPDTTGTQRWGSASVPAVPGQRGRAPAAHTHTHACVLECVWSFHSIPGHSIPGVLECTLLCTTLYQVKGEGHQLHTHTCTCLGVCAVLYTLCTRSNGKGTSCRHTHTRVLGCMLLCTHSVLGQRRKAPAADTHKYLSWNVCCVHALYQVKGQGHQLQTHTCTCLGMCVVVYMLCTRSKGKRTSCRHTHTHMHLSWNVCCCVHARRRAPAADTHTHTHVCVLECVLLCTRSVPSQEGTASTAHRHRHTHTCLRHMSLCRLGIRSNGEGTKCTEIQMERIRHRHTCTDTHSCVHVQTLTDAMRQVISHHMLRISGSSSEGQAQAHQLNISISTGEQHEKKRVRSCSRKDFADLVSEMGGRQKKRARTCRN